MRPYRLLALLAPLALYPSHASAHARHTSVACSLPEPALDHEAEADGGIDLGDLYSKELGGSEGAAPDTESESDSDSDTGSEAVPSFSASFEPVVQLDFESEKQITNLTPHDKRAGRRLRLGDYRGGFYVARSAHLGFGLGSQITFSFGNTTFLGAPAFATVGLLPVAGRESYSYRYVNTRAEALARPSVPRPEEALTSLDSLEESDMLSWETQGGIVFWGGLGAGQLGLGTAMLARGDFLVQLEKLEEGEVHVKVTGSRLTSIALQSGAGLVSASLSSYSRAARSFSFRLRYRERAGAAAFHDLVRGNIAPVQKLAAAGSRAARFHDATSLLRTGHSRQLFLGFPYLLNFSLGRDRFVEHQSTLSYACARRLEITYGAWFRRRSFKAFGHEEQDLRAFYGASYAVRSRKGALARGFFGELVLKYSAEKAPGHRLAHAMEKLAERTGMAREVLLAVPEEAGRLPYSSLTLRARFGAGHTRNILARATKLPSGFPAFERMREAASRLKLALQAGDEKKATEAYARFGQAMLSGPEAFQAGLRLAGRGARVDYTVEGSDFSLYTDTLQVKDDSGRLEHSNRSPLFRRRGRHH